jgi:hypothetical protein
MPAAAAHQTLYSTVGVESDTVLTAAVLAIQAFVLLLQTLNSGQCGCYPVIYDVRCHHSSTNHTICDRTRRRAVTAAAMRSYNSYGA